MSAAHRSAIVDHLAAHRWRVTVTGIPPHEGVRTYTIKAKDDKTAAFSAIDRYVSEMNRSLRTLGPV